MMKVMEWDVYVEKDMGRRSLKVWVESSGENADERLNWYYKDGELVNEVRKFQNVMPDGLIPMFCGPMDIMKAVIGQMIEAYPSRLFVRSDEHERMICEYKDYIAIKDAEIKKWEGRFDRTLDAALENRVPIMATLESTEDASTTLSNQDIPNALVDTFGFGWRDLVQMLFGAFVAFGIIVAIGKAFRWW